MSPRIQRRSQQVRAAAQLSFQNADGLPWHLLGLVQHRDAVLDRSRPTKISHVIINSARTTIRCHSSQMCSASNSPTARTSWNFCVAVRTCLAIFRNNGPSLNHVAYELPNIDGLMRGTGRVKTTALRSRGVSVGAVPQQRVFLFHRPNGFVAEYTTELDQIVRPPSRPAYWEKVSHAGQMGAMPSGRMRGHVVGSVSVTAAKAICVGDIIGAARRPHRACRVGHVLALARTRQ
jgi:hypothetical protein